MREMIKTFLEKEFRLTVGMEEIDILGSKGREIVEIKRLEDKNKANERERKV